MALTNDQIEELLSSGTGSTIRLKPVPVGSKRLDWATVLERFELGEKIREDEILPEIPDGVSASGFYRLTGISPTMFSEKPFSVFEEDISRPQNPQSSVSDDSDSSSPENINVTTNAQRLSQDTWSDGDIGGALDSDTTTLDPTTYGPVNQDGFMGLLGMIPGVGSLLNIASTDSPVKVGMAVLGESFGGKPSGYEPYADLPNAEVAAKAFENGYITEEQYNSFMTFGAGHYYADGQSATGEKWERDPAKFYDMNPEDLSMLTIGSVNVPGMESVLDSDFTTQRLNADFQRNFDRTKDQKDVPFFKRLINSFSDSDVEQGNTAIPPSVIGMLDDFDGDGRNLGAPKNPMDQVFVTKDGYWTSRWGHFGNLLINTGAAAGPKDTMKSLMAHANQAESIRKGGKSSSMLKPTENARLAPTDASSGTYTDEQTRTLMETLERAEYEEEFATTFERSEQMKEADKAAMKLDSEEFRSGRDLAQLGLNTPGSEASDTEDSEDTLDAENEQAFKEGEQLANVLGSAYAQQEGQQYADMMAFQQYHDDYDFSQPSSSDIADMDPSMGWLDFGGMGTPSAHATPSVAAALQEQYAQDVLDKDTSYKGQTLSAPPAPPAPSAPVYSYDDYDEGDGQNYGDWGGMDDSSAEDVGSEDWGGWASGGEIKMVNGGEAPQMPQAQGQEAEMANLGMVNEQAAAPQEGGQQSVKDDIPREADSGDYILPYETVLQVGLKQLNRYAKEAIQLAIKNGVNLKNTDLDPSDDVPIKISNYEYHIPKGLVPYFGGGKKYLDKIRDEGLALRKRLEEEKQPSVQQQQPMQPPQPQEAPPQVAQANPMATADQMAPEEQAALPMPAMMQKGGFVLNPEQEVKSTEQALTSDTSQPAQSAYNQVQAMERARVQKQQPPMVDPTGRVVQQGFAAPQGYRDGAMVEDLDIAQGVEPKAEPPMPDWANRALDPKTPVLMDEETGQPKTLGLVTDEINKMYHVYPTIRMVGKELKQYDPDEALSLSMKKKDSVKFNTQPEADSWSENLVNQITSLRDLQQPKMPSQPMASPMATVDEQQPAMPEGFASPPATIEEDPIMTSLQSEDTEGQMGMVA